MASGIASRGRSSRSNVAASTIRAPESRAAQLNVIFAAAADVFELACTDAVVNATTIGDAPAYRDLCPGAWRE